MPGEIRTGASFELSTRGLGPVAGLASLRDLFDSKVQLRLHADSDQRVDAHMTVQGLPGVRYATMQSSMKVSLLRHRQMLADQEDDVCLIMNMGPALSIEQAGRQTLAATGEAVLLDYREPATLTFHAMRYSAVRVPHGAIAPLTKSTNPKAGPHIPADSAALGLLRSYLGSLPHRIADSRLTDLVSTHVYDLMAMALGATRETAELAAERGVKAARIQAVQSALTANRDLSLREVSAQQGVSPRYVQKLFEEAGTTFSGYVLDLRLDAARAMLISPRYRHWKIIAIAEEAGFGDLSHFNRRFKARYGQTPSEVRARET